MRVIRPAALAERVTRLARLRLAIGMGAVGVAAAALLVLATPGAPLPAALLGIAAALGLGLCAAWTVRALRPDPVRQLLLDVERLLEGAFDDSYTLVVGPRLPVRGPGVAGVLVGPAGIRVLVARDWEGRYRVRGRGWEFDTHSRRGWIPCRTNPSFDAATATDRVAGWARDLGVAPAAIAPAVIFPQRHSRIVLEEPADEIVTTENVPWWANRIGRSQRIDASTAARVVTAILEASERPAPRGAPATGPRPG